MFITEALHVSQQANFTGRMLTGPAQYVLGPARPGPARWFFKIMGGRAGPPRAGLY